VVTRTAAVAQARLLDREMTVSGGDIYGLVAVITQWLAQQRSPFLVIPSADDEYVICFKSEVYPRLFQHVEDFRRRNGD